MKLYALYTGPTIVENTAKRLRAAGLPVVTEGTAHVYVKAETVREVLLAVGEGFTHRDVRELVFRG